MSKLNKKNRRLVKPKESAKGGGAAKAAGILGLVSSAVGLAGQLAKKPKVKQPKKPIERVAGRVQKPYLSMKKPKLMGGAKNYSGQKGLNIGVGGGLAKIAALGGLAYLFFGNKKKSKK